ncbi:hypothetical protein BDQ17DRAFT_1109118, partial [Cyathus striatus]
SEQYCPRDGQARCCHPGPFRSGNQFLGEGGLQDVYYSIRDKTRIIADHHADLGRTIDSSIVQHLQKLRTEIKAHIKVYFYLCLFYLFFFFLFVFGGEPLGLVGDLSPGIRCIRRHPLYS